MPRDRPWSVFWNDSETLQLAIYWGTRTFKAVIERVGLSDELASRVLIVEFHGYRSKEYRAIGIGLPSQAYGFKLVRKAGAEAGDYRHPAGDP